MNLSDLPSPPQPQARSGQQLYDANRQWAWRPDDQRFLSLDDLAQNVRTRKEQSREFPAYRAVDLKPEVVKSGPLVGNLMVAKWGEEPIVFNNWSFNQYNSLVGGPNMSWLRRMPAPIAASALQASMDFSPRLGTDTLTKLYLTPPGPGEQAGEMRAITSTSYGRIYDIEVVEAIQRMNEDGRWSVPLSAYQGKNSKLATTLYGSDRDVWVFLVNERNPIDLGGEIYFKGFFAWNSEVGSQTMGIKTFLYRTVCCNRIVWDATQVKELRIRHSSKAPERFFREARPLLLSYAEVGTRDLTEQIERARSVSIARDIEGAEAWLRARGFGQEQATSVVNLAGLDGGAEPDARGTVKATDPTNLWNIAQGISAYARGVPNTDERVRLETTAGDLLSTAGKGRR
jgi:hypothetical protein